MLLPPCVEDYVPEHHLGLVVETVDELDLSCLMEKHSSLPAHLSCVPRD
jgi:hypothetical protein